MPKKNREINPGGVNGTGKGVVNTNSKDFIGLRKAILEHAKNQSDQDRIRYDLISLKFQMESYIKEEQPPNIINAGEFLRKHLKAIKVKNKDFAKFIEIEESNLSSILRGRRKINTDLAFKLGELFNTNPNLWLLIQSKNELMGLASARKINHKKYKLEDLLKKVS
ncbi:MAG: HigA family addiction module antitoxin [Cyanobacteria bacterium J06649_11]